MRGYFVQVLRDQTQERSAAGVANTRSKAKSIRPERACGRCTYRIRVRAAVGNSLTDPSFRYVKSVETDIRKTFARERKRIAEEKKKAEQHQADTAAKVRKLGGRDPK
jgi:hypothetical protein